jgi:hypothetical protein
MNVSFEYLYRDSANYKNWGELIFEAPSEIDLADLDKRIRNVLIDGEYFVAEIAQVPTLYFQDHNSPNDHGWHEFHGVSKSDENSTEKKTIETLIALLEVSKKTAC